MSFQGCGAPGCRVAGLGRDSQREMSKPQPHTDICQSGLTSAEFLRVTPGAGIDKSVGLLFFLTSLPFPICLSVCLLDSRSFSPKHQNFVVTHRPMLTWVNGHFNSGPKVSSKFFNTTPVSVCVILPEHLHGNQERVLSPVVPDGQPATLPFFL